MDEMLKNLDELKINLLEGLIYRTPHVSFKALGEVFELDSESARTLTESLGNIMGILYELNPI